MLDKGSGESPLQSSWRAITRRLAVAAGSFAALLSLLHHVPVSIASLRGGAAWLVVLALSRVGWFALERTLDLDGAARRSDQGSGS
jgi:hypothetical protein